MIHGIIIHACVVIFDKNKVFLSLLHITNKAAFLSSEHFLTKRLDFFLIFVIRSTIADDFFFNIVSISNFDWKFYIFKIFQLF